MNSMVPRLRHRSQRRKKSSKGVCWIRPQRTPAPSRTSPKIFGSGIQVHAQNSGKVSGVEENGPPPRNSLLLLNYVVSEGRAKRPSFFCRRNRERSVLTSTEQSVNCGSRILQPRRVRSTYPLEAGIRSLPIPDNRVRRAGRTDTDN